MKNRCKCPYCDVSEERPMPFCEGNDTKVKFCKDCGKKIPRLATRCPACGAIQKGAEEDSKGQN